MTAPTQRWILSFRCPYQPGVLAAVSAALAERGGDIRDAAQYADRDAAMFFVRIVFTAPQGSEPALRDALGEVGETLRLDWRLDEAGAPVKTVIAVSKTDHCLVDLLHKVRIGALPLDVRAVVSNHPDLADLAAWYGAPYHHLPITPETKSAQEAQIASVVAQTGAELLVLARYMQVLSGKLATRLAGRCINIHHSFLPSFAGARPYHRAHARGVKLIGATAHYVTADLDEGPIIEQDVRRVAHGAKATDLIALGREVEASVLARAVRWHAERRVFLNGRRTVVLD